MITEDSTLDEKLEKACKRTYITLASDIVARGADFTVQPEIGRTSDGMHVLISYYPYKGNVKDERKLKQMIGRTARMDNRGTHSIISNNVRLLQNEDDSAIQVTVVKDKLHKLTVGMYQRANRFIPDKIDHAAWNSVWCKWFVFNMLIRELDTFPSKFNDPKINKSQDLPKWVIKQLFKIKSNNITPSVSRRYALIGTPEKAEDGVGVAGPVSDTTSPFSGN